MHRTPRRFMRLTPGPMSAMSRSLPAWVIAVVLLAQLHSRPVMAALGADTQSVENDRLHMKAQVRVTSGTSYTVHEMQTSTNTVVREYVSSNGRVFAVTWHGPLLPDLRQTLGTYFAQYQEASSAPHPSHHHLSITQPDLIVHSNGHMRAFSGQAYIPSLLPADFPVADIK